MIAAGNPDHLLWFGRCGDDGFHLCNRAVLILIAADEQLGLYALRQIFVGVMPALGGNGKTQRDEAAHARIAAADAHADICAEGKSGEQDGLVKFLIEPIECGADVILLATAIVVGAFTAAGAAKVEAQDGEAKRVQGLHGVIDHLVMHSAAAHGMRMTDDRGERRIRAAGV